MGKKKTYTEIMVSWTQSFNLLLHSKKVEKYMYGHYGDLQTMVT